MKTHQILDSILLKGIVILFAWFIFFSTTNPVNAQQAFLKYKPGYTPPYEGSTILKEISGPRIGLGIDNPTALFHIYSNDITTWPAFQIDSKIPSGGIPLNFGSLTAFTTLNNVNYGLLQTNGTYVLTNYFTGHLATYSNLIFSGPNSEVAIANHSGGLPFHFILSSPGSSTTTPLTVNSDGITVQDLLECNTFQMHTNAGIGKIMASDASGNGNWTSLTTFLDDYWQINSHGELYTTKNVGVGNQDPIDKFQVNDGAYKLSIGQAESQALHYGTSYIGFNAARQGSNWTISTDATKYGHNGGNVIYGDVNGYLRFINIPPNEPMYQDQSFTDSQIAAMTNMTITGNGYVGIGTNSPTQKLEVDHSDVTGGIAIVQTDPNKVKSEIKFNHQTTEQWAIGSGYANDRPESFFIWNGIKPGIAFYIEGSTGNMGIGTFPTNSQTFKLFVEGGIAAREVKVTIQPFPDYCFQNDYHLMSLPDLQKYITEKKHLPDIPSAEEVQKNNGVELGDMQAKLLKKIEEQTLYILSLQKQIDEMRSELHAK